MNKVALEEQIREEADWIIQTWGTVRGCAKVFNVSKSCIHVHMRMKLKEIDKLRYDKVCKVLKYNLEHRHIRGGESTRLKYKYNHDRCLDEALTGSYMGQE